MKPLVSIVIPVYNGSAYMREAIDSALAQSYESIEVIVVNDGSKDQGKTEEIALSYGDKIRYFYKGNGGVSSALNKGICEMRGDYFSWLSHDDVYAPDKVKNAVEMIEKYDLPDATVLCSCIQINKDSEIIGQKSSSKNSERKLDWKEAVSYITDNSANGCALLIPKKAFERIGMFDERLRYCQDILMWWKLFLNGYPLILSEYDGVYSRVHDAQLTQTGIALYHHDAYLVGEEVVPLFADASTKKHNFLLKYAKGEAIHNNSDVLKMCFAYAKEKKLFSFSQTAQLRALGVYGKIRPFIRRVYYRVIKKVKTN